MGSAVDLKLVVKHIANGTLGENLCRVCLAPLTDCSENVFTSICKEGKEYCVADVLKELCNIKIAECDHYNVCSECYIAASNAYKFYLNAKANEVVLNYYVDELERHSHSFDVPDDIKAESICISLPAVEIEHFDYDIKSNYYSTNGLAQRVWSDANNVQIKTEGAFSSSIINKQIKQENDDNIVVITMNEKGQPSFFEMLPDGSLTKKKYDEECKKAFEAIPKEDHAAKKRKKREPLIARECPRCPIKYRFIAKLKAHMKNEHYATLYVCRICQAITDNADDHEFHLKTHMSPYECDTCNVVFTRREAIIEHIKEHRKQGNGQMLKSNYVCVTCGVIFSDETSLKMHTDLNHYKNYTCYYCGRTYKGVAGLEKHIKKHEMYLKPKTKSKPSEKPPEAADGGGDGGAGSGAESSLTCEVCGRGFRSARSLLWHSRLHANERPFACDICGRAFVSVNRRNQHRVCSHSAPARRCPLCPALFHLRSMVNTHIKKVHLSRHKRRSRAARGAGGAAVPVQELSVALQHRVLDLQRERAMMTEESQ